MMSVGTVCAGGDDGAVRMVAMVISCQDFQDDVDSKNDGDEEEEVSYEK